MVPAQDREAGHHWGTSLRLDQDPAPGSKQREQTNSMLLSLWAFQSMDREKQHQRKC